jgi:hypothetical protein
MSSVSPDMQYGAVAQMVAVITFRAIKESRMKNVICVLPIFCLYITEYILAGICTVKLPLSM